MTYAGFTLPFVNLKLIYIYIYNVLNFSEQQKTQQRRDKLKRKYDAIITMQMYQSTITFVYIELRKKDKIADLIIESFSQSNQLQQHTFLRIT